MRIKGTKENVYEFHKRMSDYNIPTHLYRIFETDIYSETENKDGTVSIDVGGTCAWSIETCCRASGYSSGIDLFEVNSRELNLEIESWSDECGMCFQEHYLYKNGECLIDECVDWYEYFYDEDDYDSFEDFKRENDLPDDLTEEDLIDNCFNMGGFVDYCEFQI
jgi:hypothetical protein